MTTYALKKYLSKIEKISKQKLPDELVQWHDVPKTRLVLNSAWGSTPKRPFSPLIKQMEPDKGIALSAPFTWAERKYIRTIGDILYNTCGDYVVDYTKVKPEEYSRVDAWINFLKIAPMVTQGASRRRAENLEKYLSPVQTFKPNEKTLALAIDRVMRTLGLSSIKVHQEAEYMRGYFAGHSSNVTFPFYANEKSEMTFQGEKGTARDMTVKVTHYLLNKYGASWIAAVPATIIGRDQSGGLDLDPLSVHSWSDIVTQLSSLRYNPSKARVVWAVARIVNNCLIPYVKAVIDHPNFKSNPVFGGFFSREERKPFYRKFDENTKKLGLDSANIDFKAFDTTASKELMALAASMFKSMFELNEKQSDIFDAGVANMIYTQYISRAPDSDRTISGSKAGAIPSGHAWTGILGLIINLLVTTYAKIEFYGITEFDRIEDSYKSQNTFSMIGLGDDYLSWIKKFGDLHDLARIILNAFGMQIEVDGLKTARGTFFLQERYISSTNTVSYPMPRVAQVGLYTERAKGYSWATWDSAFMSKLWNIAENPQMEFQQLAALWMTADKTLLGLQSPEGQPMTPKTFVREVAAENAVHNRTSKEATFDGDPAKEDRYSASGALDSVYITEMFRKLLLAQTQIPPAPYFSYSKNKDMWANNKATTKGVKTNEEKDVKESP